MRLSMVQATQLLSHLDSVANECGHLYVDALTSSAMPGDVHASQDSFCHIYETIARLNKKCKQINFRVQNYKKKREKAAMNPNSTTNQTPNKV